MKALAVLFVAVMLFSPASAVLLLNECSSLAIDPDRSNTTGINFTYPEFPAAGVTIPINIYITNPDTDVEGNVSVSLTARNKDLTTSSLYSSTLTYDIGVISTDGIITEANESASVSLTMTRNSGNITRWDVCPVHTLDYVIYTTEVADYDSITAPLVTIMTLTSDVVEHVIKPVVNTFYLLWIYILQYLVALMIVVFALKTTLDTLFHMVKGKQRRG